MDRMEEYKALRDAPEELPPALDGAVARARARARRRRLWRRISAPAGSVAAVFAAFVLLVNLSTPFALACGKVPVLKELAAAVAFSPSLKAAVENDYVQYIGQSATDNGITVHLEYLMADQGGLMLFLSVSGPEEATFFMPRATFTTPDGERLEGCSVLMDSVAPGELSNAITVAFNGEEESQLPESLRLTCEVQAHIPDVTDAGEWTADAVVTFDLPLEPMPGGMEISAIRLDDTTAQVAFLAPMPPASSETNLNFYQLGTGFYRTPDGTVKNTGGHSTYASDILWRNTPYETPIPEGYFVEEYTIEHCYWDVISMELFASRRTTFEVPVVLTLQ